MIECIVEVIEKYKKKITSLETDVQEIVTLEEEERQIARTENYINKVSVFIAIYIIMLNI